MWNDLIIIHEGTSQVKRLIYFIYNMKTSIWKSESIDEMLTHFTKITNGLSSLGDAIDNDQKIRKAIRTLLKSWKVEAITLKEFSDREKMDFSGFIENFMTHKMEMNVREEIEPQKKKNIAFRATPSIQEDDNLWMKKKTSLLC